MNKKVFTLLAASLMLFITAFAANAQTRSYGDTVKYLPDGMGQGAYHLRVRVGAKETKSFLAMDSLGYITMVDSSYIYGAKSNSVYRRLRSALWCVNIDKPESYGKVPGFGFTNKEYGAELAFNYHSKDFTEHRRYSPVVKIDGKLVKIKGQTDFPLVGGDKNIWKFSRTYNTVPLETEQYLAIEVKPDYYMTFASEKGSIKADSIRLVVAHKREFHDTTDFYKNELLRFTLVTAVPRVLTAKDFNTMLYEHSSEAARTLSFSEKVTGGRKNPFEQPLMAEDVAAPSGNNKGHYLYLKSANGYIVMKDGDTDANYHNVLGTFYPKIVDNGTKVAGGQDEWRLVYYPSEDSMVINVREIKHKVDGDYFDNKAYRPGVYDDLYNQTIWNYLTLRMQDLSATERVITVRNTPAYVRAYFNINNCKVYDTDRTTVSDDLYTVKDKDGRYLVVPMYAGDFTPQWMYLDENEVAEMTPSCQWLVKRVNKGSEISKIFLYNREFDNIVIEYVQIYNTWHLFNGVWGRFHKDNKGADYNPIRGKNYVNKGSFHRVNKPYRNDPYLGYRFFSKKPGDAGRKEANDSINWFAFSFKYLTGLSDRHYMGFKDNASDKDTILYTLKDDKTYFRLVLPDTLRNAAYGTEKYGIGHGDGLLTGFSGENYIAPLERYFYHLKVNDYWKFKRNNNYVVLDDNARYGYTDEVIANARKLNKAKFYLRFTYRVGGVDYYTLLDRVDIANFHHLTNITGLAITDTLRAYDNSHGSIKTHSFGVIQAAVHDRAPNYVRGQVKTLGSERVSTFAINCDTEPLYRRFNTMDEGSKATDNPDTVKFFRTRKPNEYIYEDAHSIYSYNIKQVPGTNHSSINFMGVQNEDDAIASRNKDQIFKRHLDTDWAVYVDTAYVNRGTGHIKPQYMLVVGPKFGYLGCPVCGEDSLDRPYVYGRYLRNETDSARKDSRLPNPIGGDIKDDAYIWNATWDRLAFTPAIHAGDKLYILNGRPIEDFYVKAANGMTYVNYKKLDNDPKVVVRDLSNNRHKDEVFSFRYIEVGGGSKKDFLLESETANRNAYDSPMIAPMKGGWVKIQNGVPVISRGAFKDWIAEAEVWNVQKTNKAPLANREVSPTDVVVAAGVGHVVVRNASGKQVTISNILGQTIARVVLTSDDETIAAPQGVVVVAVEGENAVKAVVK